MPKVIHFEIPAQDLKRAVDFYTQVFGWKAQKWDGPMEYWFVSGAEGEPGIDGAIMQREGPVTNTVEVPDVDAAAAKAESLGATIAMPKHAVPGVGWLVYFKDPEGNLFGMMQTDPNAA